MSFLARTPFRRLAAPLGGQLRTAGPRCSTRTFAAEAQAPTKGVNWAAYAAGAAVLASGSYYYTQASSPTGPRVIHANEIAEHKNIERGLWIVIGSVIYDITEYLHEHPIGPKALFHHAGEDITAVFNKLHKPDSLERLLTEGKVKKVGVVDPAAPPPEPAPWSPPKKV
ncbi:hypothetical protein MNV49_003015 [Pseudohyphozyma bogoriensis]|nr:hypothetical protein MNV49_003015 [Pseudohyphozyma bogoriensis]